LFIHRYKIYLLLLSGAAGAFNSGYCSIVIKLQRTIFKFSGNPQKTPINRFSVIPMEFIAFPTDCGAILPFDFTTNASLQENCGVVVG
jgi:hypothetical protein